MKKLILLVLLAASPVLAAENVIIALKPDKDPDKMLAERKKLGEALSGNLGKPVEVVVPMSSAVITEGLANGTIDLAFVSAMEMLKIKKSGAGSLLLAGVKPDGTTGYKSYWITLTGKPYKSIADLQGKTVAFSSRTSTSGYLIPLLDLNARGLVKGTGASAFFGDVWFGSGYVSAVERVLSGEAEAAAVSDYVLDGDKYLSADQKSLLRKVQEQGPVPTHVLAVSTKVTPETAARLKKALLALNTGALGISEDVFSVNLKEVDEETHLKPVRDALAVIGE